MEEKEIGTPVKEDEGAVGREPEGPEEDAPLVLPEGSSLPTVTLEEGAEIPPEYWSALAEVKQGFGGGIRGPEAVPLLGAGAVTRDEGGKLQLDLRQRLLILDTWQRSGLSSKDFAKLVNISKTTLVKWLRAFTEKGPAGLDPLPPADNRGSRLDEPTKRAILMMKQQHPDWGVERLHLMLLRGPGLFASPGAITHLLKQNGYESEQIPTKPNPAPPRRFERARPNQLWQTDLFTFILKRQNRRIYLVGFMDDHSRFIVGHGLYASSSGALVREVLERAVANYGAPEEVLTDNGPQYYTWRGKSEFTKLLERRGIRQLVAKPRHPQTLGKIERFWGTMWREFLQEAIFQDLEDARRRLGHFIDYYNFQRTHEGIGGSVPADRFFSAADEVKATLRQRVAENALDLARHGVPRKAFYLTGRVGDEAITLHGEGERVVLTKEDGSREEVDLALSGRRGAPGEPTEMPEPVAQDLSPADVPTTVDEAEPLPPGTSVLDELDELDDDGGDE